MKKNKKEKKSKKILRIIIVLILCAGSFIVSYYGTRYLDSLKNKGNASVTVTFDDTETYTIPSIKKMDKEEALKEWPYMMNVENKGSAKALYQIIIHDIEKSTIKRKSLDYALYLDEKLIQEGNLDSIKDNILYTYEIAGKKEQKYKLYIWSNEDLNEENIYEYYLEFNTIKAGGPGF